MRHGILALTLAGAVAFATGAAMPAGAQTSTGGKAVSASTTKHLPGKRRTAARQAQGGQIACTAYGCVPVPRNCTPVTEYDWDGLPTGYDTVACR